LMFEKNPVGHNVLPIASYHYLGTLFCFGVAALFLYLARSFSTWPPLLLFLGLFAKFPEEPVRSVSRSVGPIYAGLESLFCFCPLSVKFSNAISRDFFTGTSSSCFKGLDLFFHQ